MTDIDFVFVFFVAEGHLREVALHPSSHVSLVSAPEMRMGTNGTTNTAIVASVVGRGKTKVAGKAMKLLL